MVKTFVAILGATGMLSLVAVGWNADTQSAPAQETELTTSAETCQAIRAAGLCERDLSGKCTPERCHAAKGCEPAQCAPAKCPGHGPGGCDPATCHADKANTAERSARCDRAQCDPASCPCHGPGGCGPSKCPGHGPEGCDPAKCPGHGPERCDPGKCSGHAVGDHGPKPEGRASDAAPPARVPHAGCSHGCRGHGTSQP